MRGIYAVRYHGCVDIALLMSHLMHMHGHILNQDILNVNRNHVKRVIIHSHILSIVTAN